MERDQQFEPYGPTLDDTTDEGAPELLASPFAEEPEGVEVDEDPDEVEAYRERIGAIWSARVERALRCPPRFGRAECELIKRHPDRCRDGFGRACAADLSHSARLRAAVWNVALGGEAGAPILLEALERGDRELPSMIRSIEHHWQVKWPAPLARSLSSAGEDSPRARADNARLVEEHEPFVDMLLEIELIDQDGHASIMAMLRTRHFGVFGLGPSPEHEILVQAGLLLSFDREADRTPPLHTDIVNRYPGPPILEALRPHHAYQLHRLDPEDEHERLYRCVVSFLSRGALIRTTAVSFGDWYDEKPILEAMNAALARIGRRRLVYIGHDGVPNYVFGTEDTVGELCRRVSPPLVTDSA